MQQFLHYFLHLIFPVFIAWVFYRKQWHKVYIIFLLSMLIDLDHLLAQPMFDACRCGIDFHPLHSYIAIIVYVGLLLHRKTRVIGIGLLMHIAADWIDCLFIEYNCDTNDSLSSLMAVV